MNKIKKGQKMKLTKIAAVVLSTSLVFGCGSDLEFQEPNVDSGDTGGETDNGDNTGSETTANLFASIADTLTDDTGELRYSLDDKIADGKLNVSLSYDSSETEAAFITIFSDGGNSTSSSNQLVDFRFDSGVITLRGVDGDLGTFTTGSFVDVEVTWSINDDLNVTTGFATAEIALTVDGEEITTQTISYVPSEDNEGAATVAVRYNANSATTDFTLSADDLIITDTATDTVVFEDDFEGYTIGEQLDGVDDDYNSSSSEATIAGVASDTTTEVEEENSSLQVVGISDTLTDDTGELRYSLDDAIAVGQVNASFLYDAAETESLYLAVFSDGGTSTGDSNHIADLKLDEGKISLRNQDGTLATFIAGEWTDIQLNWVTDGTATAIVTLTVNGVEMGEYTNTYVPSDEDLGATTVQVRYLSNGSTTEFTAYLDDLTISSDGSEVFSDDFESYVVGEELEGTGDPYTSNGSEAIVADQPTL